MQGAIHHYFRLALDIFVNNQQYTIDICLTSVTRAKPKEKMEFPA